MNIAICDDDDKCVNRIIQLLQKYKEKESLKIYTYSSGEDFLKNINDALKIDVLFLDIEMHQLSGIDVARKIREENSSAIIFFVTSHLNYISDTFRLGAFQFLVKPVDEKIFDYDFQRAIKAYKNAHQLYHIKWRDINYVVEYRHINYIESYKRHLHIYTDDRKYECVGSLMEEEKKLMTYNFVRCHQGFLVNLAKVKEINKTTLILKNNVEIPVSRRHKEKLLEEFNLFLAGRLV